MPIFIVRMEHPDGDGWGEHVIAHVRYLQDLIRQGRLLASGPVKGGPLRAGFLVMSATDRAEVDAMIAADPFAIEGLICGLTVEEWDPLFGLLAGHSSGRLPPVLDGL